MFEKVNPAHPDKIADRIAGAIVDLAYKAVEDPKIAVEVLIGHGTCTIIIETDTELDRGDISAAVVRIAGPIHVYLNIVQQDPHLAENQKDMIRCGDNGIFRGSPVSKEEQELANLAGELYDEYGTDGKYIHSSEEWCGDVMDVLIVCQSNAGPELEERFPVAVVNPLGHWTGGTDVDTGATNRKLGSDMGRGVTGGGLHGKDLSKADVSVNIYCHLISQKMGAPFELSCAIGDETVDNMPYSEIVEMARDYIRSIGGFEKFAEWGLIRPEGK